MASIDCPRCGKSVMTYARFLREAEPYKVHPCGHCGAPLARSKAVWLLLLIMSAGLDPAPPGGSPWRAPAACWPHGSS